MVNVTVTYLYYYLPYKTRHWLFSQTMDRYYCNDLEISLVSMCAHLLATQWEKESKTNSDRTNEIIIYQQRCSIKIQRCVKTNNMFILPILTKTDSKCPDTWCVYVRACMHEIKRKSENGFLLKMFAQWIYTSWKVLNSQPS